MLAKLEKFIQCATYVLERVDALGGLLDLTANDLWNELLCQLSQCACASLPCDNLGHLLADRPDLR